MKKTKTKFKLPAIQTLTIVLFIFVLILDGLIIYAQTMVKISKPANVPVVINQGQNIPQDWRVYRDDNYGFTFHYPKDSGRLDINDINLASEGFAPAWNLVLTLSRRNQTIFQISTNSKENEGMIRNDLGDKVDEVRVGSQSGERFLISRPDGTTPYLILVKKGDLIYSFVGTGEQFDAILATFRFLK